MRPPKKALILAAGLGTRMRPITHSIPKPLLPVWGKPVLHHILDRLAAWGVEEVLINLHHNPQAILQYLAKESHPLLKTQFSYEPQILGTGGALRKAEWFLDTPYFWMVNSDIAFDINPKCFFRSVEKHHPVSTLWLTPESGPRTVEMDRGLISDFKSRRPGTKGTYTFCGLQLLSPEILSYMHDDSCFSIVDAYEKCILSRKSNVIGISPDDTFWYDIGTPDAYLEVHRKVRNCYKQHLPGGNYYDPAFDKNDKSLNKSSITTKGFVFVGKNVSVGSSAHIENSVILDRAVIGKKAVLKNVILAPETRVSGNVTGFTLPANSLRCPNINYILKKLGWTIATTAVQPLDARGSARTYSRIRNGTDKALMVQYSMERPENGLYVAHSRFLKQNGIRVPDVLLNIPSLNSYVLEDVDSIDLEQMVKHGSKKDVIRNYIKVIDQVILFHQLISHRSVANSMQISQPFSKSLYQWERNLFKEFFLMKQVDLTGNQQTAILEELEMASRHLLKIPHVLVHRDLQSTNIILYREKPVFIDFQGMRSGPAQYDLASLLCDPYVSLSPDIQHDVLAYYADKTNITIKDIEYDFWIAAIQRLIQAIGAYGRLSSNYNTRRFSMYMKPAFYMLRRAVKCSGKFSHIENLCDSFLKKESA